MFPIYILNESQVKLPDEGIFFIVARGGLFMHKETGLVRAMVRVDTVSFLRDLPNTEAELKIPKLPQFIFVQCLNFFRLVQKTYQSEAVVLLHYCAEKKEFLLHCPNQQVNQVCAKYKANARFEGFQLVGSIHSHNNFQAFHSPVDIDDEEHFDGLHITIGDVDLEFFTLTSSIVVNNNRFPVSPGEVIEGIVEVDAESFKRHCICLGDSGLDEEDFLEGPLCEDDLESEGTEEHFYDICLDGSSCQDNWKFPEGWKGKVRFKPLKTKTARVLGVSSRFSRFAEVGSLDLSPRSQLRKVPRTNRRKRVLRSRRG